VAAAWRALLPGAAHAAVALPAAQGAQEEPQREAQHAALLPGAAHAAAALLAARGAEEEPQREVQDAAVAEPVASAAAVPPRAAPGAPAQPLVVFLASAFRRDQAPPWPAPSPSVRFARAMAGLPIASP
jgi:hypothetical protein